ncbi:MAG: DUF1015 family protein [Acidimicrobiales bacterium]
MATVEPLGLRLVTAEFADRVPSPAHDSLTPEGRRLALEANPESYLAVTRSLEDLDPSVAMSNDELLALGRRSLDRLIALGAFDGGHAPRFFAYRLATDTHCQTGLVGGVATADFAQGVVRAHEQIHHARSTHLARHLAVVGVQSSPIAVAHRPIPELRAYLDQATEQKPAHTIASEPGFTQTIWPIDATASPAITDLLRPTPLYLIDGHHRGAAAVEYRRLAGPGNADSTLCVLFAADELANHAFHRVLPPAIGTTATVEAMAAAGARPIADAADPLQADEVRMYDGSARRWRAIPAPSASGVAPALADLPPTRLAARFDEVFGAFASDNVGGHRWRDAVQYRPGVLPLPQLLDEADDHGGALFLLPSVGLDDLFAVADAGLAMPPKSTYFDPKVRSGVFLRHL